jgi:hypothetical protein
MNKPMNTFTIIHDECEHDGDIDRDHGKMRAHCRFRVVTARTCHGPEVGVSVIKTTASASQIEAALAETCVRTVLTGNHADQIVAEEEGEYAYENDDEFDHEW